MEDENLLRNYITNKTNKNAQTIATIISNLGYVVFGPLLPSKDNADDIENVDIRDIPDLESEEDSEKKHGSKIMTPSQLITRLTMLLAQKQAGNNSQKLNNEIRRIIYSLYMSKNLSKTVYNHLINSI